ncbi:MAG: nucleoside hydrolase [Acidimicrobiales bacterium]
MGVNVAVWRRVRRTGIILIVGLSALAVIPAATAQTMPVPVVFDTDMDYDDAAALAYLSQEHKRGRIDLRAVTVTNNGAGLPGLAIRNARCLLQRFGLGHIPVADGSPDAPHVTPPELRLTVQLILTTVLLGCFEGTQPGPVSAAQLLVDSVRNAPSDVVLIATGPLSNVAGALRLDLAALADRVAATYLMGGAVHVPGNLCCTTTLGFDNSQELNMWIDPAAAQETFRSLPEYSVSMIPLDATRFVPATTSFAERLRSDQQTPEAQVVAAIANHPLVTLGALLAPVHWWDPLAAMAATRPGVVTYQNEPIVVVQDSAQSGRTAPSPEGRGLHVGVFADRTRFEQTFIDALNGRAS